MKILLTNDDGIHAPGLRAVVEAVSKNWDATVVAPSDERSATSHSVTLGQKLRLEQREGTPIPEYALHGTPVDCVKIAISEIEGFMPDLVVSGINQGANTGVSVYYSGTIAAAREGVINRIPSVAVSLCHKEFKDFSGAVEITLKLIQAYEKNIMPKNVVLNVNVPGIPKDDIRGIKITKQAESHFIEEFILEKKHQKTRVYSLVGEIEVYDPDGTSDEEAVAENYISITPLKVDLTAYDSLAPLQKFFTNAAL